MTALTLAEEIVLLALDDESGRPVGRTGMAPDRALAGALLMQLALSGRVDTDRDHLMVVDPTPTGDPTLDAALARLAAPGAPADARGAIPLLARDAPEARAVILERLVARGILRRVEDRLLWILPDRRYPKPAGRPEATEARARLRALLLEEDIPSPHDALLLGLVRAAGLLPLILSAEELARVQAWLAVVTRIESLNRSLGVAVADIRGVGLGTASRET
ncbi:GOLPH3/VPS74 family protein [Falsiroseomonas sp. HC035]|uniref:GOLPH3/VPS74 family protein n=1 Tax=Falsiroseomonas sp. HC035 TaxID=3390999 RepID=UPI003D31BCB9